MEKLKRLIPLKFKYINYYRSIHSIKTAVACLIGLGLEKYFNWPSGQWVPITIMVVMSAQTRFGGALQKAYMRFLGTVGGVITTSTTLWLFGAHAVPMFIVVFFACLIFTYIASNKGDISYAGTLGGVTTLLTLTATNATIEIAIQRGLYIVIGIVIALLISRFVFPLHARDFLRINIASTLRNLKKQYYNTVKGCIPIDQDTIDARLEASISEDLADQPRLIFEAGAGSRLFAAKRQYFMQILASQRQIHRCVNLMYHSLHEIDNPTCVQQDLASLDDLHTAIVNQFESLAACIEATIPLQHFIDSQATVTKISQVVATLPKNEEANTAITEYSFLFFIEQILKEIDILYKAMIKISCN